METQRKAIVTAAGPNMWPLLEDYALPSFEAYGAEQGFTVNAERLKVDGKNRSEAAPRRAAKMAKYDLLEEALSNHEVAVWFDADIVICRSDDDITSHLRDEDFQAFVLEQVPYDRRINPNAGVWVMRQSDEAFDFIKAVRNTGPLPGRWTDQPAIFKALGWDMGDENYQWARPSKGSHFLEKTAWLPPGWNQPYLNRTADVEAYIDRPSVPEPHAVHFMGMEIPERHAAMAEVFGNLTLSQTQQCGARIL